MSLDYSAADFVCLAVDFHAKVDWVGVERIREFGCVFPAHHHSRPE